MNDIIRIISGGIIIGTLVITCALLLAYGSLWVGKFIDYLLVARRSKTDGAS